MCLVVDSLIEIEINNIIASSNNKNNIRKVNAKPYRFDKMYMNKDLIKDNLNQIID